MQEARHEFHGFPRTKDAEDKTLKEKNKSQRRVRREKQKHVKKIISHKGTKITKKKTKRFGHRLSLNKIK